MTDTLILEELDIEANDFRNRWDTRFDTPVAEIGQTIEQRLKYHEKSLSDLRDEQMQIASKYVELWHSKNTTLLSRYKNLNECLMQVAYLSRNAYNLRIFKQQKNDEENTKQENKKSDFHGNRSASSPKDPVVSDQPSASDAARQQAEHDRLEKAFADERKARIAAEKKLRESIKPESNPADTQRIKDLETRLERTKQSQRELRELRERLKNVEKRARDAEAAALRSRGFDVDKKIERNDNNEDTNLNMFAVNEKHFIDARDKMDRALKIAEDAIIMLRAHRPYDPNSQKCEFVAKWYSRFGVLVDELNGLIGVNTE